MSFIKGALSGVFVASIITLLFIVLHIKLK